MAVGERIAAARAEVGLTQAQLASAIGVDRTALAKIETNRRNVSAVELVSIAAELGRRVEWFVEPGPRAIVSYRTSRPDVAVQEIDGRLDRLVRDVEFVATEMPSLLEDQPEAAPVPKNHREADALAETARSLLGLPTDEPVRDLTRLVTGIALLPFSIRLGNGADAGTVLLPEGGVTVINGDLNVGRRRLALAHEIGHYLVADEYTTDWRVAATDAEAMEARFDRFARALLLPEEDLRHRWADWTGRDEESLRDAAVRAGSHYQVDMATLARRLQELALVKQGVADYIRQVQTKKADIVEKNLIVPHELEPISIPLPYAQAVLALYRRETINAGRAIDLLLGTFDEEALPDLPPLPDAEIWTVTS